MEWVLLDSTRLDAFAFDPTADAKEAAWQEVWLSIALDLFSRSIVGWVFTAGPPKSEDIALLIYRIAAPKTFNPTWPEHGHWRYPGAPEHMVCATPEAAHKFAGVPFGRPNTFVVDHGKVYLSQVVFEACRVLHSSLQLARVKTPTDKSPVEALFRRIRQDFLMPLPGYKGPNIFERGTFEHVEGEAFLFIWEIEEAFAEWVACDYQNTSHRGLRLQAVPELELTPNEAFDFGVTTSGQLPVPPPRELLIELLPTEWRVIHHYGVEIDLVRYEGDCFNGFRLSRSPWDARGGRYLFKRDRTNRSMVWFWLMNPFAPDPAVGTWKPIRYRGWDDCPIFADAEVAYAKAIIIGRGGDVKNRSEFEATLDRVLHRLSSQQDLPSEERRILGRTLLRALNTGRELATHGRDEPVAAAHSTGEVGTGAEDLQSLDIHFLGGPVEEEVDFFADLRHDVADPGGYEDLAAEPQTDPE